MARTRKPMPWMVACLLPLVSMALILTSFGSESHVLLAKVPLAIRLVLLVIALALPFIAACTVDWHLATQPHAPLPSKLFFILACLFVFSTITTFFDALQGLERNTISGGQGWLAFVACGVYDFTLIRTLIVLKQQARLAPPPPSNVEGAGGSGPAAGGAQLERVVVGERGGLPAYELGELGGEEDAVELEEGGFLLGRGADEAKDGLVGARR